MPGTVYNGEVFLSVLLGRTHDIQRTRPGSISAGVVHYK